MSNALVGSVYEIVINDVIEAVGVDFEEAGVDASVLQQLKMGWQQNLSKTGVATFPWDPKPTTAQETNTAQTNTASSAPSSAPAVPAVPVASQPGAPQANYTPATLSPPQTVATNPPQGKAGPQLANGQVAIKTEPVKNEPAVKQEPGLSNNRPLFNLPQHQDPATQRALQNMSNRFGPRAEASISSFHNGQQGSQPKLAQQGHPDQQSGQQPGQPGQPGQQPGQPGQPQQQMNAQQYGPSMAAAPTTATHQPQQPPHATGLDGLPNSQVDGSSETLEDGVVLPHDTDRNPVEMGRVEIDNMIHSQIAARAKQMEGGGLMLTLKQATKHRNLAGHGQGSQSGAQVDGPDGDTMKEEEDADAINSDLDDPDDDQEEDEDDDDSMGHMMLCMYDKVQRVKNKWKCTLKDGVLTVNGREYVFHKATGEYEW